MTTPQLIDITRRIATLSWTDRLTLIGQILRSFLTRQATLAEVPNHGSNLTLALAKLRQICLEENYTLIIPDRANRANPFGDE